MKTLSIFVVLMFLLSTVSVIAQDTSNETTDDVNETISETLTENEIDTTPVQVGKEYSTLDSVLDRIKLAFTFQEERKVELMNKIEQKREQHYSFLVAKGKTEQADKFKAKTIGLVKNFEQWKEKKAAKLANVAEKAVKKLENKAEAVEQRVQERTAEMNAGEEQQIMQQNQENVNAEAGSDSGFKGGNK